MGQQNTASHTATQEQAAAALQHFFDQRVAEVMPAAFGRALGSAPLLANWLQRACAHGVCSQIGKLQDSDDDVLMVGSFSAPTLLALLMDSTQPDVITVAVRNALVCHFLADSETKAHIKADAEGLARRAIAHLVQVQQLERAEAQSLYGREHQVPGVAPLNMAAVTTQAQHELAQAAAAERV